MDRKQYMKQLAYLLQDVPDQERSEAMQYYEDYFEEAGPEQEDSVIKELGSPEKVAAMIKAELAGNFGDSGEYTERGYEDQRFRENDKVPDLFTGCTKWEKNDRKKTHQTFGRTDRAREEGRKQERGFFEEKQFEGRKERRQPERQSTGKKVLLFILLGFLALTVGLPVLGTLAGVLISALAVIFGLVFGGIILVIVFLIVGMVCIGIGIAKAFVSLPLGLLCSGIGCLLMALGVLMAWICTWAVVKAAPWTIRKLVDLCSIPFHRGEYGR